MLLNYDKKQKGENMEKNKKQNNMEQSIVQKLINGASNTQQNQNITIPNRVHSYNAGLPKNFNKNKQNNTKVANNQQNIQSKNTKQQNKNNAKKTQKTASFGKIAPLGTTM